MLGIYTWRKTYSVLVVVALKETFLQADNVIGVHEVGELVVNILPVLGPPEAQPHVCPERNPGTIVPDITHRYVPSLGLGLSGDNSEDEGEQHHP